MTHDHRHCRSPQTQAGVLMEPRGVAQPGGRSGMESSSGKGSGKEIPGLSVERFIQAGLWAPSRWKEWQV